MSEKINWPASSGYCVGFPFFQLARPLAPIQSVPSRAATARGNSARLIKIPRAPEGEETHSYSLRDVETMLAVLPEPAAAVCAVAAFAGLRRSELRGVRWEDYDREQIMVMRSIWEAFTNDPKTKRSKSPVPVIPRLQAILAAHKLACGNPKSGPMFANGAGKPANLNNILNRKILPVLNRCGVCRQSKLSHDAGEVSHENVRDGSLPKWQGFHSFAVDSLPPCTISEWMT
jgi:integrase